MKKFFKAASAAALCVILLSVAVTAPFAETVDPTNVDTWHWANPNDLARIREFFGQADPNGVTNGDKLLRCEDPDAVYNLEDITRVFEMAFDYGYNENGDCEILEFDSLYTNLHYTDMTYVMCEPDYYGEVDFSGTSLHVLNFSGDNITAVHLDNCDNLKRLDMYDMLRCTELTARNANNLRGLSVTHCKLKKIDISIMGSDLPLVVNVLGAGGSVLKLKASNYGETSDDGGVDYTLFTAGTRFYGWYSGGKFVSMDKNFEGNTKEVNELVAVYTGDADRDGVVTTSDALCVMRSALGIDLEPIGAADTNDDNITDMTDALRLMRFTMGLGFAG